VKQPTHKIELSAEQAEILTERIQQNQLEEDDQIFLVQILQTVLWLQFLLTETKGKLRRIKNLFKGIQSEKRSKQKKKDQDDQKQDGEGQDDQSSEITPNSSSKPEGKTGKGKTGNGKTGADQYTGAEAVVCKHPEHQSGELCPYCELGHFYSLENAKKLRLFGKALVNGIVYFLERLRCSACGIVVTAPFPEDAQQQVYDESVGAVLAFYHYYLGLPFKRIESAQNMVGIPFPDSTQYAQCKSVADCGTPIYEQLKQEGANSDLVFHDDTGIKILSLIKENKGENPPKRTGMHTTALVFEGDHNITLYITGRQHAGENLDDILDLRDKTLPPITQMADGLSCNNLKRNTSILCNCITHGRRKFIELESTEPEEVEYVIDKIGKIYYCDKITKDEKMSAQERLVFHQKHSKPIMDKLQKYLQKRLDDNIVETNSDLGKAFKYLLKRWDKLIRFLSVPGAPLDNNNAERAIKILVRYRKASSVYANENGAHTGDVIMSLAETFRQNGANPILYFETLMRNKDKVSENPAQWMPWNYHENIETSSHPPPIVGNTSSHRIPVPQ